MACKNLSIVWKTTAILKIFKHVEKRKILVGYSYFFPAVKLFSFSLLSRIRQMAPRCQIWLFPYIFTLPRQANKTCDWQRKSLERKQNFWACSCTRDLTPGLPIYYLLAKFLKNKKIYFWYRNEGFARKLHM